MASDKVVRTAIPADRGGLEGLAMLLEDVGYERAQTVRAAAAATRSFPREKAG